MFYKLEPRPKYANCPHCLSTDTFISAHKIGRYCNNCDRIYDASDEALSKERTMDNDYKMRLST